MDQLGQLSDYYQHNFGLDIPILKTVAVPTSAMGSKRGQLVAEELIDEVRNALPERANDPNAILIGFTSQDMYIGAKTWRFAFGWREADARTAVVSTARMNLHYPGEPFWGKMS